MTEPKPPEACESLADIRAGIDSLDRQIVRLLAERGRYVVGAARFKRSAAEVQAPARVEQVIANVRGLAAIEDTAPEVVERVYRTLIAAQTELEQQHWGRR